MTIGIFGILDISKEALYTQQAYAGVIGHNIANVDTPGYSRQKPLVEAYAPQVIGGVAFGRGSHLSIITKSYDRFLNNTIMIEKGILGRQQIKESSMTQAESIFNESDENGLNNMLSRLWNAWQDLADNTVGIAERTILQGTGLSIATNFNNMSRNLERVKADANDRIADTVYKINKLAAEIAELNELVLAIESQNANANDLTDQRTIKIEEIAQLIDVTVIQDRDGQVTVLTSSGRLLASENLSWELTVKAEFELDNFYAIKHVDHGLATDITDKIAGGSLKGLLEIRDVIVPGYIDKIDLLAASLITEVNKTHYQGYGLDGTTGNYFFNSNTINLAADSENRGEGEIYDAVMMDPTKLKASDFDIRFLNSTPMAQKYEIYDTRNDEYVYHIDAGNSAIVFNDTAGGLGNDATTALTQGTYTGSELAAEIERQLEAASEAATPGRGQNYTVAYDDTLRKFTITNQGTNGIDIKWYHQNTTAGDVLGFKDIYTVRSGINDRISFDDGSGGLAETATLRSGSYRGKEMAAEIERALESSAGTGFNVDVTYVETSRSFRVTVNGTVGGGNVNLNWASAGTTAEATLGFTFNDLGIGVGGSATSDFTPDILIAANDSVTSNVKAGTYTYADPRFEIKPGMNDTINFNDDGGANDGKATLVAGIYTGEELAAQIETQLEAASEQANPGAGRSYTVSFDNTTNRFTITYNAGNPNDLDLFWNTSNAAETIGFNHADTTDNTMTIAAGGTDTSDSYRYVERTFDITALNNQIVFDDGGIGDGTGGTSVTAAIANGKYTGIELAAEIEKQLEITTGSSRQDYIVTFDTKSGEFTIINARGNMNSVDLDWTDAGSTAAATLGFTADDTISAGSYVTSDTNVGEVVTYDSINFYGISVKMTDNTAPPRSGDVFHVYGVKDAAKAIGMDQITYADSEKIAAAQNIFDIDATNNTIVFDDDGDLTDVNKYRVVIPSGKYTPDELADEIERQLEQNGSGQSYAVRYDSSASRLVITNNSVTANDLVIYWEDAETTAEFSLGFNERLFTITSGYNNTIGITENGNSLTVNLTPGSYTGEEMAEVIQDQLRSVGSEDYTVTYDSDTRGFTITNPSTTTTLIIQWTSFSNISSTLGFSSTNPPAVDDDTIGPGGSATSDFTIDAVSGRSEARSDFDTGGIAVGDNRNALDIAVLKDTAVINNQTITMDAFYHMVVAGVGADADETMRSISHQGFMVEQLEQRRQSLAGVSLDEEMINLVKSQQAYAASAKLITILNEMLEKLISI